MANFSTPVRIPRSAFDQLIARVDEAVAKHAVALQLSEDFPFRALDPISADSIDFSNLTLDDDPLELVDNLDQLLYFAFERSSDAVIISWAEEHDPELKSEAIERVKYIRGNMRNLANLWRDKSYSLVPPLVGFSYEPVSEADEIPHVAIYLSAARIRPGGEPDRTDAQRLRVQLWPSDVRVMIRELEHIWEAHLSSPDRKGSEEDANQADTGS